MNTSLYSGKKRKPSFFFVVALIGLLACLIGFSKTFIIPSAKGTFSAPAIIYVHAAFVFSWVLLYLLQTSLIQANRYAVHATLGFLGIFIAAGVAITIVFVGHYVVERDLPSQGDFAYSSFLGNISSPLLFASLVTAGIVNRHKPAVHKRWMLLAMIVVLWPAWFRFRHFFPDVPRPDIWFGWVLADSLILIAWIWDRYQNGFIHPVLRWGGLFIIMEQGFEVFSFGKPFWITASKWLYGAWGE